MCIRDSNGDFNEAKLHFQKATDIDQNFTLAYFHLGKILNNPSEYDQAYRNYETALEIEPNLADCHYWFAKLLIGGEKLKSDGSLIKEPETAKAKEHLERAIEISRTFAKAYFKLGLIFFEENKYKEAMKNFELAIKYDSNFAEAHFQVALLLMNEDANNVLKPNKKAPPSRRRKIKK